MKDSTPMKDSKDTAKGPRRSSVFESVFDSDDSDDSVDSVDSLDLHYGSHSMLSDLVNVVNVLNSYSEMTSQRLRLHRTRSSNYLKSLSSLASRKKLEKFNEIDRYKLRLVQSLKRKSQGFVTTPEKLWFAFGLLNILYCGIVIGSCPEWFHVIYTSQLAVLMPLRVYIYIKRQFHYFLLDLCYFVNLLCIIYIWLLPSSTTLFISCYAFTFGTLSWAVLTWKNSLVLHSLDKTTSTFIHLCPPAVFHVLVHCLPPDFQQTRFPAIRQFPTWPFLHSLLIASVFYMIWQTTYHYFITHRRAHKIQAGRPTSFVWLKRANANKPIGKFVASFPESRQVFVFMIMQYFYQLGTMVPITLWFKSKWASGAFMSAIFSVAAFNGASYYIDVLGKRVKKEIERANGTDEPTGERAKRASN